MTLIYKFESFAFQKFILFLIFNYLPTKIEIRHNFQVDLI